MFHILFEQVNNFYEKIFASYGRFLAKHYVLVITFAFILNVVLSCGTYYMKMEYDSDKLFIPTFSEAKKNAKIINNLFNSENLMTNDYYMHQMVEIGTYGEINFLTCPPINTRNLEEDNILKENYIRKIKKIHANILANTVVYIKNVSYDFESVCARQNGQCVVEGSKLLYPMFYETTLEKFMNDKDRIRKKNSRLGQPENEGLSNKFSMYISGRSATSLMYTLGSDFRINSKNESKNGTEPGYSNFLKLRYSLNSTNYRENEAVRLWELKFIENIRKIDAQDPILICSDKNKVDNKIRMRISYSVSSSLDIEMVVNLKFDKIMISCTFVLIFVLATCLMSINTTWITAPGILLASAGICSAFFGVTSSFGFLSYIGYTSCDLSFIAPFLVIGIGIDDMFIIYSSFKNSSKNLTRIKEMKLEDLMIKSLRRSGVSITITSLTDFAAFMVGSIADFKSVQIFCVYVGVSILFCYIYQLTIFCGFLCVHVIRIKNERNTLLWCVKQKDLACCLGNSEDFDCKSDRIQTYNDKPKKMEMVDLNKDKEANENDIVSTVSVKNSDSYFKKFSYKLFEFLITKKAGKAFTFVVYIIYLSISIWSASKIKDGMNMADLVSENSYYHRYHLDNMAKLNNLNPITMFVIHEPVDYDNFTVRNEIFNVQRKAQNLDDMNKDFLMNWLLYFDEDELIDYKKDPFDLKSYLGYIPHYKGDVLIKQNKDNASQEYEIIGSRFYLQYKNNSFSSQEAALMHKLENICKESFLPILVYSVPFCYFEQFEATIPSIFQACLFSTELMFLIGIIFIPDLISVISIIISMISIMIGLIGAMQLCDLRLNTITMVIIIMSIGFCIDFSAHIVHAFIADVGSGTRNQRALKASLRVGVPIFNSALSTFTGICLLFFTDSFIFQAFFKTLTILMVLGVINSLFFLPVLLSLIGPNWPRHKKIKKNVKVKDETLNLGKSSNLEYS